MFGAKRKARKIKVQDDEDEQTSQSNNNDTITQDIPQEPALQASFKSRKPSTLRKTINIADDESISETQKEDDEDGGASLRIRPSLGGRGASSKLKNRGSSSRLSFGPSANTTGEDEDSIMLGEDPLPFVPKKTKPLAAAATENSAYKKGIIKNSRLPLRSMETDEDRPRYSKEYLSELQSSTPNTPANLGTLHSTDDDDVEMSLDPSELEGATVVETTMTTAGVISTQPQTTVLTDAEILEKKARRSRLAAQAQAGGDDFISLSDDDRGAGDSYLTVLSRKQSESAISKKKEKRLVADDNLDDDDSFFVEDGGLSLGRKAERAARRKKRADMAAMIASAEGVGEDGDETSDDSEAERRAAYEVAQTRAGMDGLAEEREQQRRRLGVDRTVQVPPKITPLPDLSVLVEEFKAKMGRKQLELQRMRAHIHELKMEREGIEKREPEVQKLLDDAGERYKSLMGGPSSSTGSGGGEVQHENGNGSIAAARSLLDQARPADTPGRGLESLGATPVRTDEMEM